MTPVVSISRTSGPAPLGVMFNASETTHPTVSNTFRDLLYIWTTGDSGTYTTGRVSGISKNVAAGPILPHCYESAGTYSPTLTVFDGLTAKLLTHVSLGQITVTDPDTVFSGTATVAIGAASLPVAGVDGVPAGATCVQQSDWPTIVSTYAVSGKRVLLKHDDTFTGAAGSAINSKSSVRIGMYGAGEKPIVRNTGTTDFSKTLKLTGTSTDIALSEIDFDGESDTHRQAMTIEGAGVTRVTLHKCDMHDMGSGFDCVLSQNTALPQELFISECDIDTINYGTNDAIGHGIGIAGKNIGIIGTRVSDTVNAQHTLRAYYMDVGGVRACTFRQGFANGETITLRAPLFDDTSVSYLSFPLTRKVVISDCQLETTGNTAATIKPTQPENNEHIEDVIFERNWCWQPVGGVGSAGLVMHGARLTSRNNIYNLTESADARTGVSIVGSGAESPASSDCRSINDTVYTADVGSINAVTIQSGATDSLVANLISWTPNSTNTNVVSDSGTGTVTANNSTKTQSDAATSPFVSDTPSAVEDFTPDAGHGAADSTVKNWQDFFANFRGSTKEMGAVEVGTEDYPVGEEESSDGLSDDEPRSGLDGGSDGDSPIRIRAVLRKRAEQDELDEADIEAAVPFHTVHLGITRHVIRS